MSLRRGAGEIVMGPVWLVTEWRLGTHGREERDLCRCKMRWRGGLRKDHMAVPPLSLLL